MPCERPVRNKNVPKRYSETDITSLSKQLEESERKLIQAKHLLSISESLRAEIEIEVVRINRLKEEWRALYIYVFTTLFSNYFQNS
jgi:hypothetical protein